MRIKHFLPAVLTLVLFTAAQFAQAASLPEFSELAAKCGPAVVNISAERTSPAAAGPEEFFGEMWHAAGSGPLLRILRRSQCARKASSAKTDVAWFRFHHLA